MALRDPLTLTREEMETILGTPVASLMKSGMILPTAGEPVGRGLVKGDTFSFEFDGPPVEPRQFVVTAVEPRNKYRIARK